MFVQKVSLYKAGYACEFSSHVLLFHTTPLPVCMYCGNFSSSVHVGALSQPFHTPVYHRLQYAKTERESYHVTHSTGSTSLCLLSRAVMHMYETNLAFCAMKMVRALAVTSNISKVSHLAICTAKTRLPYNF